MLNTRVYADLLSFIWLAKYLSKAVVPCQNKEF